VPEENIISEEEPKVETAPGSPVEELQEEPKLGEEEMTSGGPAVLPSIKINITSSVVDSSASEPVTGETVEAASDSEFDPEAIVQEAKNPELYANKPKMKGKKFQEFPMQMKGKELSWYCSIM
jgi:hypothetical protein